MSRACSRHASRVGLSARRRGGGSGRRGLSLVEVIVGLALLATLVVGLFSALTLHQRQIHRAERDLHAQQIADRLLSSWFSVPLGVSPVPRWSQGAVPGEPRWLWRTRPVGLVRVERRVVEVVRLEIVETLPSRPPEVACQLDLLGGLPPGTKGALP